MYSMNAKEYNEVIMKGLFQKIYPVIAAQVVERTNVRQGYCIDLGGGPGMLGICLAAQTDLYVTVYDLMPECVDLVAANSLSKGVQDRVDALQGMAEQMPFDTGIVDLIVSRGSVFFWEDQPKGLSEVYRVLKPGGWAYIGGGFGTVELLREIQSNRQKDPEWETRREERMKKNPPEHFERMLNALAIEGVVEWTEAGTWIIFQKPF
jgi:ubiquinone/menaquinone biosynthesis C-methylase UbiE